MKVFWQRYCERLCIDMSGLIYVPNRLQQNSVQGRRRTLESKNAIYGSLIWLTNHENGASYGSSLSSLSLPRSDIVQQFVRGDVPSPAAVSERDKDLLLRRRLPGRELF